MPPMVVARTGAQTEEEIRWVTLGRPETSRLYDIRVNRYLKQWTRLRRLCALAWVVLTLTIVVAGLASSWLHGSRLLFLPVLMILGYLGYRFTRSRWPGDFHSYVATKESRVS